MTQVLYGNEGVQVGVPYPAATIAVGADGRIIAWNGAATHLLGYESDEAIGRGFEELLGLADDERWAEIVRQSAGGPGCFMGARRHRSGAPVNVSVTVDPGLGDDAGTSWYTMRDATHTLCLCAATDAGNGNGNGDGSHPVRALTTRQRQVLRLIAEGRSTRDIAVKLALSVKTIETHRGHLMQRLKLKSVAGLVRYAVTVGLVPASPFSRTRTD